MRNAFAAQITQLAGEDDRVVLLSGDIGNRMFDTFKAKYPDRFYNCGVAEANMISVAAGLAMDGMRPFCYTIAPFVTSRCFEQIKIDVCYHNLPVTIVGTGSGLSYAELGATHHSFEDIACMRVLPNMKIICPADPWEVTQGLIAILRQNSPAYLRIGKKGEPMLHKPEETFIIGESIKLRDGMDLCFCGTGNILAGIMDAAVILEKQGISAAVHSFHTVKPLNHSILTGLFSEYPLVVTAEEHSLVGGFGAGVAEWLADQTTYKGKLIRIGLSDDFVCYAGDQENARDCCGLSAAKIADRIINILKTR